MKLEKVLLIDDSDIDNMVNKKVIEKTGVAKTIVIKKSAQSALDYLKDLSLNASDDIPDVIFLDIRMPEIDGFGFLEKYENPEWKVYELRFSGMACGPISYTVWFVVKADTIIDTSPENEEDTEN